MTGGVRAAHASNNGRVYFKFFVPPFRSLSFINIPVVVVIVICKGHHEMFVEIDWVSVWTITPSRITLKIRCIIIFLFFIDFSLSLSRSISFFLEVRR